MGRRMTALPGSKSMRSRVSRANCDARIRRPWRPCREEDRNALSNQLYGSAYKGITDLVTKFWWPKPAKRVVAWCAERRITPNMVTVLGLLLMLLPAGVSMKVFI